MTDQDLYDRWAERLASGCDDATAKKIDALLARVYAIQAARKAGV